MKYCEGMMDLDLVHSYEQYYETLFHENRYLVIKYNSNMYNIAQCVLYEPQSSCFKRNFMRIVMATHSVSHTLQ